MIKSKKECLICGSKNVVLSIYPGYIYKGKRYKKLQCRDCRFIFIDPIPNKATLEGIYNDQDYFDNYSVVNAVESGYLNARDIAIKNAEKVLGKIKKYTAGNNLLEIGCAGGFFLSAAKGSGFDIRGVELNEKMAEFANKELGGRVIHGDISDAEFEKCFFDVVYMGDVLEHIPQFSNVIDHAREVLKDGGILAIEGPVTYHKTVFNFFLKIKCFLRKGFYSKNPPTHLWEFTPKNLKLLLELHGYKILYSDLCEKDPSCKKFFQGTFIRSLSWYLKAASAFISNRWFGKKMGFGDRIVIVARK